MAKVDEDMDVDLEPARRLKLVVVGDNVSQKNLLLFSYAKEGYLPDRGFLTVFENHTVTVMINDTPYDLSLWDTSGQEDYDRLRPLSYPDTNVILLCFSVMSPDSFENIAQKWLPEVKHFCPKVPYILVGVHTELRDKESPFWGDLYAEFVPNYDDYPIDPVTYEAGVELAKKINAVKYLECSFKTGEGLSIVFQEAILAVIKRKRRRFKEGSQDQVEVESIVKMFVVGNPGVGKSTLTKALKTEATGINRYMLRFTKVVGIVQQTAGIVPHDFSSRYFGNVTLYDFAGHREFYASHDALIRNAIASSSSVVFMIVLPLSASESEFKTALLYWLCFLENQCSSKESKPSLIVVGSQYDAVKKPVATEKIRLIEQLKQSGMFSSFDYTGHEVLDCRIAESKHMLQLRDLLSDVCSQIKISAPLAQESTLLYALLCRSTIFSDLPAVTVGTVAEKLKDEAVVKKAMKVLGSLDPRLGSFPKAYGLPWNEATVAKYCKILDQRGHVLYIENEECLKDSWVILQIGTLLQITATIFAPEGFKEYRQTATATGLVPFSKLASLVPDLNPDMIVQFLIHLDFCHEVSDPQVISLLQSDPSTSEKLFFFPELVNLDIPDDIWQPDDQFDYHCGWIYQCTQPEQFLMPRFLQVLLLRIAFRFAFKPSNPSDNFAQLTNCTIWKTGMRWASRSGVETLVEVRDDQTTVLVLLRCTKSLRSGMNLVHLRSSIIKTVMETKEEFCPRVTMQDYMIRPTDAHHYPPSHVSLVSITEIIDAIKENDDHAFDSIKKLVGLDELLFFEPYKGFGLPLLQELFKESAEEYHAEMTDEFLYRIADQIHDKTDHFIALFNPTASRLDFLVSQAPAGQSHKLVRVFQLWREKLGEDGSRCNLRKKLDEFSIFAGRNILHFTKTTISC